MAKKGEIIASLDIGTSNTRCIASEVKEDGEVEVIGVGTQKSSGMSNGSITNIEETVHSIRSAVGDAELMAGVQISDVFVGISGPHIKGQNSDGTVPIKGKEIEQSDIDRVLEQANAVPIPMDRRVLHTKVQEYVIDDQAGVKVPLGISGVRLKTRVHIITAAASAMQNIERCCNKAGLNVCDMIFEPLAASYATLTPPEKDLGCIFVDIGAGTSDILIYSKGALVHTGVIASGGNMISNDIAVSLRTPPEDAERIKEHEGCALAELVNNTDTVDVPRVGVGASHLISRMALCDIIEARMEEIFSAIISNIEISGMAGYVGAGTVLTGGCTSLKGIETLAEEMLDMPVRVAQPKGFTGLTDMVAKPKFSTSVGLVMYGARHGATKIGKRSFWNKIAKFFGP